MEAAPTSWKSDLGRFDSLDKKPSIRLTVTWKVYVRGSVLIF